MSPCSPLGCVDLAIVRALSAPTYCRTLNEFSAVPLSETTDIGLLEGVINDQTTILKTVYGEDADVAQIPQIWTLCKLTMEVFLS